MKPLIFLLFLCLFLSACARKVYIPVRETVTETETIRDTVIRIEKDSAVFSALLECDSTGNVLLKQLLSLQSAQKYPLSAGATVKDNRLNVTARVDSMSIYLKLKDHYRQTVSTEIIEVNKLTTWQHFQISALWIIVVLQLLKYYLNR